MEQRRAKNEIVAALLAACAAPMTLGGCAWLKQPTQQVATPAARNQEEGRPLNLLPPFERVDPDDAIVRIVGVGNVTCTGTLIADDRVLTAHHCVAARDRKGHVLDHDMAPADVQIELGGDYLPWGEVKVRAIVAPQCGFVSGDGDIAILVLERHLIGMPTVTARIESPPEIKDELEVLGFGRCALSRDGIRRVSRKDPDTKAPPDTIESVAPGQFTAIASICPGDSGGPVRNKGGDLIGVVSASVMDADARTKGLSLFTRVDVWPQLFSAAHEISLGASPSELPPYGECRAPASAAASHMRAAGASSKRP